MIRGVFCGLGAAGLWALTYFLPLLLPNFSAIEVSCGRYIAFGLFSVLMWQRERYFLSDIPKRTYLRCFAFSLTAFFSFFALHVLAIQLIGAGFAALVMAFLPVAIAIIGNLQHREFSFSLLSLPLVMISVGIVSIHLTEASFENEASNFEVLLGIGACLLAVTLWAWYASESRAMAKRSDAISPAAMTNLIGLMCLGGCGLIMLGTWLIWPDSLRLLAPDLSRSELYSYLGISIFMGTVVSWLASLLWQRALTVIPVSLAGQLLVFEIILALIYIYLYEWRMPTPMENVGVVLVIGGISLSIRRIARHS